MPELWGGSADLAGSNNTTIESAPSFLPASRGTEEWKADPYQGRVLHFGIREHGMGAIMNGIAADGLTRVFGGTFLTFSDYMRGAVRVAALSQLPVTYVWTHDSIGLGEDGPTHQPIEHLAALRAMPGLDVVRPADANETAACWQTILEHTDRPAALALTRQNVPVFPRGGEGFADTRDVHRGGYVLHRRRERHARRRPDRHRLRGAARRRGTRRCSPRTASTARVVSLPCLEWFEEQDAAYRDTVLPPIVKARVSVEAGVKQGWRELVGDHGRIVSIDRYGASADYARIYQEFGITAEAVADAARDSIREGSNRMSDRLQALADAGVSIWLDDLSRERIETGNLADLVKDKHVVGVTTNPTIFAAAIADGERYDDQVRTARRRRRRRRPR